MGHYPSSVKELIMAQAENRRKLPMAFLCGALRAFLGALCALDFLAHVQISKRGYD
jgi:hypothetical protein